MKRSFLYIVVLTGVAMLALYLFFRHPVQTRTDPGTLVIFNWEDYLDKGIIADFEKETGISVTLVEYKTTDEQLARLQEDPGAFDLVISNNSSIDFLKKAELIRPFEKDKLPGHEALLPRFSGHFPWAVPYLISTSGFIVDTRQVPDDADSVDILWDPKYRGRIRLLDDLRDALIPLLLKAGRSINDTDPAGVAGAGIHAGSLRDNGVSFGDTFDNIAKVMDGSVWIAQTYNGDYLYKARGRAEYRFLLPREGFGIMSDQYVLTKAARNPEAAHRFVAFLLTPQNAARSSNTYFYANAVQGSESFLLPELKGNAVMFPAEQTLKRGEEYRDVGAAHAGYQRLFNLLKQPAR